MKILPGGDACDIRHSSPFAWALSNVCVAVLFASRTPATQDQVSLYRPRTGHSLVIETPT